jgi:hypothetical protein
MSIKGAMSAYEKMLENPANRRSTAGELKQPMPGSVAEAESGVPSSPAPATIEDADDLWMKDLDRKMAARKNQIVENAGNSQILNELKEVKEMLKMVLDVNMKLIQKLR